MAKQWTADDILKMAGAFQPACVLTAAAELGVFDALADGALTAEALAAKIGADARATTMLADAMSALQLLVKSGDRYAPAAGVAEILTETGPTSALAMVRHQANCLRSWAQLADVVTAGRPAPKLPSIRGEQEDLTSFIEAMDNICRPMADKLVASIGPPGFSHLLDIGGGPATWTIAFLRAAPDAVATLLDLPDVVPIARKHIAAAGLTERVTLVAGDMQADAPLPGGADLAWISAIVHMNSRSQNRDLFAKTHAALVDGGQILIRDVLVDAARTDPPGGAMFAINMLVHTPGGGTFTFDELSEDLAAAGFRDAELLHAGEFMDSVIRAVK
ncbi:hypothetical protein LCGC14_0015490 [marine sediment metagenome]|uniref:O-methyltransferase domain-containing protein n=1 Tax=marine sediment metagenome TaxID=412755 RepID=A0A0F9WF15_9ZZZZ|nr:methyltransferase domain-containing protein [Phycisphaerae bacterium]HDZ44896.1 methyltransferase domain-containing protein [Phycisphaerae bacterium]